LDQNRHIQGEHDVDGEVHQQPGERVPPPGHHESGDGGEDEGAEDTASPRPYREPLGRGGGAELAALDVGQQLGPAVELLGGTEGGIAPVAHEGGKEIEPPHSGDDEQCEYEAGCHLFLSDSGKAAVRLVNGHRPDNEPGWSADYSPDRPPRFETNRNGPISTPRSTDLTMS